MPWSPALSLRLSQARATGAGEKASRCEYEQTRERCAFAMQSSHAVNSAHRALPEGPLPPERARSSNAPAYTELIPRLYGTTAHEDNLNHLLAVDLSTGFVKQRRDNLTGLRVDHFAG